MTNGSPSSILTGSVLVASGAIGAGMFALPIVSAGMWFGWACLCLIFIWWLNLCATLLMLENNLLFPRGASFDTMVGGSLGQIWKIANNTGIMFVMYILLYAYFSASGSIVEHTLTSLFSVTSPLPEGVNGVLYGALIALLVWSGITAVARICTVLLIAMTISFAISSSGLTLNLEAAKLFDAANNDADYMRYIWASLPYFVTSFACAGLVPSLVRHYGHQPKQIKSSIFYGTLIALLCYLFWLAASFGTVSRAEMATVITAGGNMGQLVATLQDNTSSPSLDYLLNLFSNFAITTSFISIGLGLMDFIRDKFKFGDSMLGRTKSALLTFLPPAVMSYLFPHGFVLAIGYAGLVVLFSFFVVPVVMTFYNRQSQPKRIYQLWGGAPLLILILTLSLGIAMLKILASLEILATYP